MAASNKDHHIFFNILEKIAIPPGWKSFQEGAEYIGSVVKQDSTFVQMTLHENLDPNGLYKVVNEVVFTDGSHDVFQGPPSAEWRAVLNKGTGPRENLIMYGGGYAEVASASGKSMSATPGKGDGTNYLLVMYKDTDIAEASYGAFEADWKTKTGATIIADAFPSDIKSGDIALYKRRRPGVSPFIYVLRCEILPGASVENVLQLLPTLREKLTEGGIPFSDVAAYKIVSIIT